MVFFLNVGEMHWVSAQCFFSKANTNNTNKKNWKKIKWFDNLFPDVGKYASNAYLMFFFEGPQNKLKKIQILHNGFFTQCGKKYNL